MVVVRRAQRARRQRGDGRGAAGQPRRSALPGAQPTAVVMIVMDEFPIDAMLRPTADRPRALPHFRRAGRHGHLVQERAHRLRLHHEGDPGGARREAAQAAHGPTYADHPQTVFDLFGPRGYRIVKSEEATALCPPRYCRNARRNRPLILPLLQNGRRERLTRFFDSIGPGRPTFWMKHVLLPARSLPVPAVRQADAPRLPGPAARHEQRRGLRQLVPDRPQPAAAAAPDRLCGPRARQAVRAHDRQRASSTSR